MSVVCEYGCIDRKAFGLCLKREQLTGMEGGWTLQTEASGGCHLQHANGNTRKLADGRNSASGLGAFFLCVSFTVLYFVATSKFRIASNCSLN